MMQKTFFIRFSFYAGLLGLWGVMCSSCEDRTSVSSPSEQAVETVHVPLCFSFSDESSGVPRDGEPGTGNPGRFDLKSSRAAFEVKPTPDALTRASAQPDALYNLEVRQYDGTSGSYLNGKSLGTVAIGSKITVPLTPSDNCQLIIVARGDGNTVPELGTRSLSDVQTNITANSTVMNTLTDMNKMPYVLHLKHVKVVDAGNGNGTIRSTTDGTDDVRLRLKRLAVRLSVHWTYSVPGYELKQILLQSVPLNYAVVPSPDGRDGTYPSLLNQFTTLQVSAVSNYGSYSCWIPANVRGESASATSAKQRTKVNSPVGGTFLNFVAAHTADSKKKLDYRVYLGGEKASDFNLHSNTNYNYTVRFAHADIPTDDGRVTYIDPVPASENNANFVPTANCFMVAPGGSFCFDPFMFRQNGADIENTVLTGWSTQIQSVKLLWQTKENGDVGDPVMGIVNSVADHTNIVDIKNTDGTAAPYVKGKARIYCRVAANTTGGSGVIAAYDGPDGTGNILWSWHVWVTDYSPSPTGNATVLKENKKKLKFIYAGLPDQLPFMDRNLGAFEGYDTIPGSILNMSRANGFHYQKGRKDPFPSSYTTEKLPALYKFTLSATVPPKHILNRYEADGFLVVVPQKLSYPSVQMAYRHPMYIANPSGYQWCSDSSRPVWSKIKTVHDPCPAGWRIPEKSELQPLLSYNTTSVFPGLWTNAEDNGGLLLKYDGTDNRTYLRFTGYPPNIEQLNFVGRCGYSTVMNDRTIFGIDWSAKTISMRQMENYDAHTARCIQERAD